MLHGYPTLPQLPVDADPPPMALMLHGGPWDRDRWPGSWLNRFLGSRGYAVLRLNYRGPSAMPSGRTKVVVQPAAALSFRPLRAHCRLWQCDRGAVMAIYQDRRILRLRPEDYPASFHRHPASASVCDPGNRNAPDLPACRRSPREACRAGSGHTNRGRLGACHRPRDGRLLRDPGLAGAEIGDRAGRHGHCRTDRRPAITDRWPGYPDGYIGCRLRNAAARRLRLERPPGDRLRSRTDLAWHRHGPCPPTR